MKIKAFLHINAIVLSLSSFFLTKANKKYIGVNSGDFKYGLTTVGHVYGLNSADFTTSSSAHLVRLVRTFGGSSYTTIATLYTNATSAGLRVYHR